MGRIVVAAVVLLTGAFAVASTYAGQITEVIPASGPTAGSTTITISGTGFSAADNLVTVGGQSCTVTEETTDLIKCTLPPGTGASRPIRVGDASGSTSPPFPFAYREPLITSISFPALSTVGDSVITIVGENFGSHADRHVVLVTVQDQCGSVNVVDDFTKITCTMPPGQGTNVPVSVIVDGQESPPFGVSYDPPAITAITPTRGASEGGTIITIHGTNFGGASLATVGAGLCPVENQSDDAIRCTLPPGTGVSTVRVVTSGQASGNFPFTYGAVPSKCDAAKFKAAGKHAACLTNLEAKAAKKGFDSQDPALEECDDAFTTSCTKAESKFDDCSQPGTCLDIEAATGRKGWDGTIKGKVQ